MDTITATLERIKRTADQYEAPEKSQTADRKAGKFSTVPEMLHNKNKLSAEQIEAWRTFEAECHAAEPFSEGVASYNAKIGGSDNSDYCPQTRRMMAQKRVERALAVVGELQTCRVLVACIDPEMTLEILAKHVLKQPRVQGRGAAIAMIQLGSYRLSQYYRGDER